MLRIVVSKEKGKRRECASPATLPRGDVIERNVRYSILRGKEGCLEGRLRVCGQSIDGVCAWAVGLSEKVKVKECVQGKGKIRKEGFNDDKGDEVTRGNVRCC